MKKILSWITQIIGKNPKKEEYKKHILDETAGFNFSPITSNWEKNKQLYDELKKKCHPDLFTDEKADIATQIFQMLIQKKYSYSELLKIKEQAEKELGISFKTNIQ
jgi:DNA-directed RNA polymerase specialized sigma54-like protein